MWCFLLWYPDVLFKFHIELEVNLLDYFYLGCYHYAQCLIVTWQIQLCSITNLQCHWTALLLPFIIWILVPVLNLVQTLCHLDIKIVFWLMTPPQFIPLNCSLYWAGSSMFTMYVNSHQLCNFTSLSIDITFPYTMHSVSEQ